MGGAIKAWALFDKHDRLVEAQTSKRNLEDYKKDLAGFTTKRGELIAGVDEENAPFTIKRVELRIKG